MYHTPVPDVILKKKHAFLHHVVLHSLSCRMLLPTNHFVHICATSTNGLLVDAHELVQHYQAGNLWRAEMVEKHAKTIRAPKAIEVIFELLSCVKAST
jgi:hypothetical protein